MTWKEEIRKQRKVGMTVGELIAKLNTFDKSSTVYIDEHMMTKAIQIDRIAEGIIIEETDGDLRIEYAPNNPSAISILQNTGQIPRNLDDNDKCVIIYPVWLGE